MKDETTLTDPVTVAADLWATSILPEGIIERWLFADGSLVEAGDPVAIVRIEDALHDVMAPCSGRLQVSCRTSTVIEPGTTIGHVTHLI